LRQCDLLNKAQAMESSSSNLVWTAAWEVLS